MAPVTPAEDASRCVKWNTDKPHRCPACHAVAIDTEKPSGFKVYTCCRCGTRFARHPRLARVLADAGVQCSEHRDPEKSRSQEET